MSKKLEKGKLGKFLLEDVFSGFRGSLFKNPAVLARAIKKDLTSLTENQIATRLRRAMYVEGTFQHASLEKNYIKPIEEAIHSRVGLSLSENIISAFHEALGVQKKIKQPSPVECEMKKAAEEVLRGVGFKDMQIHYMKDFGPKLWEKAEKDPRFSSPKTGEHLKDVGFSSDLVNCVEERPEVKLAFLNFIKSSC